MNHRSNYFKLGIFIISAVLLLLVAVFFMGARELLRPKWLLETYFDHSVQGLDVGSPVKRMGVKIGSVKAISFVNDEYDTALTYVYVLLAINPYALGQNTPGWSDEEMRENIAAVVAKGFRLTLATQGLTGAAFLDANLFDPGTVSKLEIDWEPEHPYFPSMPGTLTRISKSLEDSLQNIGPMISNIKEASESLPELMARLNQTVRRIDDFVVDNQGKLIETFEDLQLTSKNFREVTDSARKYPSHTLFGKPPPRSKVIEQP